MRLEVGRNAKAVHPAVGRSGAPDRAADGGAHGAAAGEGHSGKGEREDDVTTQLLNRVYWFGQFQTETIHGEMIANTKIAIDTKH